MSRWIAVCSMCVFFAALTACSAKTPVSSPASTAQPSIQPSAPFAKTGAPAAKTAAAPQKSVTISGRLSFIEHRRLTFSASGKVAKIYVSELDRVTKGQKLVAYDTTSLEQALKSAEISASNYEITLNSAKIDLEQAKDSFRKITYPYSYHTFAFDVPESLVNISDADREINNAMKSLKSGEILDATELQDYLQKALDSLNTSRDLLKRGEGDNVFGNEYLLVRDFWTVRAAQLAADKSQLAVEKAANDFEKAKNDLEKARDDLNKATLTAPIDGVVARISVKEGDYISSTSTVAVEIIDPGRMALEAQIYETDVPGIKPGQKVNIHIDALPGSSIESMVASVASLPDVSSGVVSYQVKVIFDTPANLGLKSGMGATANIFVDAGPAKK